MRRGEKGQALILALILLALVAALVVPSLRLTNTVLKGSPVVERRAKVLYAVDGAQEYIFWKLRWDDFDSQFTTNGQQIDLNFDVCGVSVNSTVIMRAVATWRGVRLAGNTPIKPTKTVTGPVSGVYTYTIKLERISDNMTEGLDAVYDILPSYTTGNGYYGTPFYDYQPGSSQLSVDGGESWQSLGYDPLVVKSGGNTRLQWPPTYNYSTNTGAFTSPMRDFAGGQIKEIRFKVRPSASINKKFYNWVVLKPWDTLSGATAPIGSGSPSDGLIDAYKSSDKTYIPPGTPTILTYTITITNLTGSTKHIDSITDYLPVGFEYYGPTSGMTTNDPNMVYGDVNGVLRWKLTWSFAPAPSIGGSSPGNVRTLTFKAITAQYVSGSYYNEVLVVSADTFIPTLFSNIGITSDDFNSAYTWNSAPVIVPAYDSSSNAEGTQIDANMATTEGGIVITSWQVY